MSDDFLEDLDDKIWELKMEGEIDRDTSRSDVIRMVLREWVEGNSKSTSSQTPTATAEAAD